MTQQLRPWLHIAGLLLIWLASILAGSARADTITYFHNDPAGSPVAATDASGRLLWKETYRPYGERLRNGTGPDANQLWFAGQPQDPDTGLSYLGARYYSPQLGRFMGIDPKEVDPEDLHGFNRYAYANNNPYKFVDPDGRAAETFWDAFNIGLGVSSLIDNVSAGHYGSAAVDAAGVVVDSAAAVIPLVPGGAGFLIKVGREGAEVAADAAKGLPDNALVCRGGSCTADKFASGSGVTVDASGKLNDVSVNSAPEKSLEELTVGIPHNKVGVTTVGDVRESGGDVIPSPTKNNPNHATLQGITPQQAQDLMTPTVRNPNAR